MTELEILLTTTAMAIAIGVIWWTLDDFPSKPKREPRVRKPHLCRECGTTDSKDFYPRDKGICKVCRNKATKARRRALKEQCNNDK